jgi:CHASE2 domain-containing sensor protein
VDPPLSYINLDLWIERGAEGEYTIRGMAPQGDVRDTAIGDPATLGAHDEKLSSNTADAGYVQALGNRQYRFVFNTKTDKIQRLFDRCIGAAGDGGVRLRLRLGGSNPEIAAVPWEFVHDGSEDGGFLASSDLTPIVRFVDLDKATSSLEARLPLNMLVVIPDVPDLDVDGEKRRIKEALEGIEPPVTVTYLEGKVTRNTLSDALQNQHIDFLHFVGHGDVCDGKGRVRLNLSELEPDWIDEDALAEVVRNRHALKLIVLNTCQGATLSTSHAFAGVAPQLVLAGVPAVVAMQFPITDKEALTFVRAFYHALFQGIVRGSVDAATTAGRSALKRDFPDTRAIGLPVLFMRYDKGLLFQVVTGEGTRPASYTREEQAREEKIVEETELAIEKLERYPPGSPGAATPEELAGQRATRDRARTRLRFLRRTIATAVAVPLVIILAAAGGLFDRLPLTWLVAASPVWFGDPLAGSLPVDSIALVTTKDSITPEWRPRHAELLTRLSRAGARVVAFDVRFRVPTPHDEILAAAVDSARARGTQVVAGANQLQGDSLALAPALVNRLAAGIDCLGENPLQFSGIVPLLWSRSDTSDFHPAFALSVVKAWRQTGFTTDPAQREVELTDSRGVVIDRVKLTKMTTLLSNQGCMMTAGTRYGEMLAVRAPLGEWRDPVRRFDYAAVLALPPERLEWARGRIVLVGVETAMDLATVRSEERYGVERHADAIATILGNAEPTPVGGAAEYLIVAGLAALGGLLAYRGRRRLSWSRALLISLGVLAGLFVLSTALYWSGHRLLNLLYPLLAFLLTFASLLLLRRRWLL